MDFEFYNIRLNLLQDREFRNEKIKKFKIISLSIVILGLFAIDFFYLIEIVKSAYENYRLHLLKAWLIPILLNIIFIRFVVVFASNLILSLLLFRAFHWRCSPKFGWIYNILVGQHLVCMYQVRNLVSKYKHKIAEMK